MYKKGPENQSIEANVGNNVIDTCCYFIYFVPIVIYGIFLMSGFSLFLIGNGNQIYLVVLFCEFGFMNLSKEAKFFLFLFSFAVVYHLF